MTIMVNSKDLVNVPDLFFRRNRCWRNSTTASANPWGLSWGDYVTGVFNPRLGMMG